MKFVLKIIESLEKSNASDVQDTEKYKKILVKMVHKLEPEDLLVRINEEISYSSSNEKVSL